VIDNAINENQSLKLYFEFDILKDTV